ncbi:MAG: HAD family hydrolase [Candidatus Thorarchaeota archaeon]
MICNILIALDFDETILHTDGRNEDYAILPFLNQLGIELCIASRNDRYHLEIQLDQLGIRQYFRYVMADFRPKSIQMKHLLWLYEKERCRFNRVLFVDDYLPNIQRVREDLPFIHCLQFGHDIQSLSDLSEFV